MTGDDPWPWCLPFLAWPTLYVPANTDSESCPDSSEIWKVQAFQIWKKGMTWVMCKVRPCWNSTHNFTDNYLVLQVMVIKKKRVVRTSWGASGNQGRFHSGLEGWPTWLSASNVPDWSLLPQLWPLIPYFDPWVLHWMHTSTTPQPISSKHPINFHQKA